MVKKEALRGSRSDDFYQGNGKYSPVMSLRIYLLHGILCYGDGEELRNFT